MIKIKWNNIVLIEMINIIKSNKNNWYDRSDILDIIADFWEMIKYDILIVQFSKNCKWNKWYNSVYMGLRCDRAMDCQALRAAGLCGGLTLADSTVLLPEWWSKLRTWGCAPRPSRPRWRSTRGSTGPAAAPHQHDPADWPTGSALGWYIAPAIQHTSEQPSWRPR